MTLLCAAEAPPQSRLGDVAKQIFCMVRGEHSADLALSPMKARKVLSRCSCMQICLPAALRARSAAHASLGECDGSCWVLRFPSARQALAALHRSYGATIGHHSMHIYLAAWAQFGRGLLTSYYIRLVLQVT